MNFHKVPLLIIFFALVPFALSASYKKGVIIKRNNEKVLGFIKIRGDIKNRNLCTFKANKEDASTNYSPKDISAYRIFDRAWYVSEEVTINGKEKTVFLEVLLDGKVSLYYDRKNADIAYYLKKDGSLIALPNSSYLIKPKETLTKVTLTQDFYANYTFYIDSLTSAFKDKPDILPDISKVDYDSRELMEITRNYLLMGDKQADEVIVYEKDLNRSRVSGGIYSGVQFFNYLRAGEVQDYETTQTFKTMAAAAFMNVPINAISERLSFQTELLYTQTDFAGYFVSPSDDVYMKIKNNTLGIPLLLKFRIPFGNFSTWIGAGKETSFVLSSTIGGVSSTSPKFHVTQKGGWLAEIGADFKIAPKFSVFVAARAQTHRNLMVEPATFGSYNSVLDKEQGIEFKKSYIGILGGFRF